METLLETPTATPVALPSEQVAARKRISVASEHVEALPHPPTESESVAYFSRHGRFLATWYFVGIAGFVVAFTSLLRTEPSFFVFAPYFVMAATWLGFSTYLGIRPRDPDLQTHRDRVIAWSPAC